MLGSKLLFSWQIYPRQHHKTHSTAVLSYGDAQDPNAEVSGTSSEPLASCQLDSSQRYGFEVALNHLRH